MRRNDRIFPENVSQWAIRRGKIPQQKREGHEIFSETAQYLGETALYQSYLGEINRQIAGEADEVTEVVYGIPVYLKGGCVPDEKTVE